MDTNEKMLRSHLAAALDYRAEYSAGGSDNAGFDALNALTHLEGEIADAKAGLIASLRAQGHSWTPIGMALGVSKQAAQQRYGDL